MVIEFQQYFGEQDIKPGVIDEMGSTLDLFPTFMSNSNISYKDDNELDGVDIKETFI